MNEKTISRRSLLKLASASTVTAAAVLPSAARAAQADQWDETYEIIVVGAGGAGMAAAVKAAQKGAKHVVVLEKLNFPGGNTLISQGFINAADPVRQPKQGIKDSWQHHAEQTLEAGDFRGQKDRVDVLCDDRVARESRHAIQAQGDSDFWCALSAFARSGAA